RRGRIGAPIAILAEQRGLRVAAGGGGCRRGGRRGGGRRAWGGRGAAGAGAAGWGAGLAGAGAGAGVCANAPGDSAIGSSRLAVTRLKASSDRNAAAKWRRSNTSTANERISPERIMSIVLVPTASARLALARRPAKRHGILTNSAM